MFLCRVTGTIVSVRKDAAVKDSRLLVVHPIDTIGDLMDDTDMLAVDPGFGAALDDVVLVAREGSIVRQLMKNDQVPGNVIILGVVDGWSAEA